MIHLGKCTRTYLPRFISPVIYFMCFLPSAYSQMSINGPTCVTQGTQYTYTISGNWTNSTTMTWSVTSGTINGSSSGTPLPQIKVTWSSTMTTGTVSVVTSNPTGSANLNITATSNVAGGTISNPLQTIAYNTVPARINCSAATGGACSPSYSYQWDSSTDGSHFYVMSRADSQNLSFSAALTQTTYYKRFVTETVSNTTAYSTNTATVTVNPPVLYPGATTPTNQLTNVYTESPPFNFTAAPASGGTCQGVSTCYTYQWQTLVGSTWTSISGANSLSYNPGSGQPTSTSYYRLQVGSGSQLGYSPVDTIVYQSCVIGGPTECWLGQTTTYYYYYGSPISSYVWNPSTGATIIGKYDSVATLTVKWMEAGLVQPINLSYGTGTKTNLTLYVNVRSIPTNPGYIGLPVQNVEQNSVNTLYPSPAYGGTCSGVYSLQWQQSTDSINYTNITGQTGDSLVATVTGNIFYRRQVLCGTYSYTDTAHFTTYPYFNPGTITLGTVDSTAWNTAPLPVSGTLCSGGIDSVYTYQWFYSIDGSNYYQVSNGGQGVNYQPPALATSTYYYRQASCGPTTRNSNVVLLPVQIVHFNTGTIGPYTSVINSGTSPTLTSTAANGGTSSTYTYQWQQSYDEINWTNIGAGTGQNYSPPAMTRTTYFRRNVTNNFQSGLATVPGYNNDIKVKVEQALTGLITPNGATQSTSDPTITPILVNAYTYPGITSAMVNSIISLDVEKPAVTTLAAAEALTSIYDYRQNTTYFDDLGREIQTVAKQVTPDDNDLISVMNYDELGRSAQKYLPYYDSTGIGTFRTNPASAQPTFYNNFFSNTEGFYYSNTIFDGSALNRIVKITEPGNSWTGTNIGPRMDYTFNASLDSVQIWKIGNNITDTPTISGVYAPGTLTLLITTDENENKTMEYKDMEGKTILRKVQLNDTLFDGYYGWISTYYVYDYFNRLRYVLSPKAVQYAWSNNWTLNPTVRSELCFQYNYDSLDRMITKIVPGAGSRKYGLRCQKQNCDDTRIRY